MTNQRRETIIFDFDGTLVDSFPVALDIFYALTHSDPLPRQDMTRLRGMTLVQVAKELRIPTYSIPFLLFRGRRVMRKRMTEVDMIAGMEAVIRDLARTHKLFILSSNSPANITMILERHDIRGCFEEIHGNVPLLAKSRALRQLLRKKALKKPEVWYVGDEARDIESAHKNGIKSIAVSWGYNNIHILSQHTPTALVFSTVELLDCFKHND